MYLNFLIKKLYYGLIILISTNLFAQNNSFEEQIFFKKMEQSYYSIVETNTNNFTVLITNLRTETFAKKNWNNSEIFPLQLIWFESDRVFLAEQGVPSLSDSAKNIYTPMISDLKTQVTGVLYDLKRFYFNGIYKSISQDYILKRVNDLIEIKFTLMSDDDSTHFKYYFGENGLCLKIIAETPSKNTKVETYPQFKIIKTKWLITGWEVQMSSNNEIETGFVVKLKSKIYNDNWVPIEMLITVQQAKIPGKTFTDVVKFRNFLFNQPLQYIQSVK